MKIKHENNEIKMLFDSVMPGDVFMSGEYTFIKVEPLQYKNGVIVNAIDLSSGTPATFRDEEKVQFVAAELIVRRPA